MPRGPKGEKRPTDDGIGAAVMSDMASANSACPPRRSNN
jgi:hypothetical protein